MKKLLLSTILSVIFCSAFAQVTLKHKFENANPQYYNTATSMNLYQFSTGDKYVQTSIDATTLAFNVTVYNLDKSINKNFSINPSCTDLTFQYDLFYISDKLFDTDNGYEVCLSLSIYPTNQNPNSCFPLGSGNTTVYIYNDDNSLIFKSDTSRYQSIAYAAGLNFGHPDAFKCISITADGAEMLLSNNKGVYVYSLPGSITTATIDKVDATQYAYQVYPNPATTYTKIDFELPANEIGTISIYDVAGTIIKNYQVDNTFCNLVVNNQDFKSGTYFYTITSPTVRQTKKVVVIN